MAREALVPLSDVRLTREEIGAAEEALESGWLTMGPRIKRFEEAFAIHEFSAYAEEARGALGRAEEWARTELTLPLHPHLTDEHQGRAVAALIDGLSRESSER